MSLPIYWFANLVGKTLKIRVEGAEAVEALDGPKIYAGWHGRTFVATQVLGKKGVWAIISHSHDGMIQNVVFSKFGFKTVRGSTGKGGAAALVQCVKILREGHSMAFTPDGPRGPSGIVQAGIMLMAKKSGAWIVPCASSASHRWLFHSWDRFMIPKPFAKATLAFGEPVRVPPDSSADQIETARMALQAEMHRMELMAEATYGHPSPWWHAALDDRSP